jgi:predicted metal-dependent enzyme (double-stranded beta helix superfamily)
MQDEYYVDHPAIYEFISLTQMTLHRGASPAQVLPALRPAFAALLADPDWLPGEFRQPAPQSGMGGGIASWLLYRAGDGSLSLMSLVVPAGSATPIHDHLAWGLVGLYVGEQDEDVFEPQGEVGSSSRLALTLTARNHLKPGDFYELLPPKGDIHRVITTSALPSISIHLLGNDVGCVWRHRFDDAAQTVQAFRSGYTNAACRDDRPSQS